MKSFYTIQKINDKTPLYQHKIQDKQLMICDGKNIIVELNDQEIMRMLKALGIATNDFEAGFKFQEYDEIGGYYK